MNDTFVVVAGIVAAGFSVASAGLPRWSPSGPPVVDEARAETADAAWRFAPDAVADADGWLVAGRVVLPPSVARGRLILGADCDGEGRWFGARIGHRSEEILLVVPEPLRGCTARIGAVAVGAGLPEQALPVSAIRVSPAERNGAWTAVTALAIAAWTAAGVGAALRIRQTSGGWILGAAVGLSVVVGVCLPGDRLDALLLAFPGADPADLGVDLWVRPTVTGVVQKLGGHGLAFLLLGAWGRSCGASATRVLVRCLGFALATEAVQLLIPSRSGRWEDVLLDTAAAGVGIAGVSAGLRLRRS